jgi:hypothetical protein
MVSMRAELEQHRDRDWLACFVLAVLALPCVALTMAVPGLVGRTVVVGVAMLLAVGSYAAGRSARSVEQLLEATAVSRHPAQGRADAEQ